MHGIYLLRPRLTRAEAAPCSSSQIDLQFISELAACVPVVPVLAKADTMTADELKVGRAHANLSFLLCAQASLCCVTQMG